jgi:hypothetical protein
VKREAEGSSLAKATVGPQHVAVSKRGRYAAGGGGGGFGGLGGGGFGGFGDSMDNPFRSWSPRRRRETPFGTAVTLHYEADHEAR